MKYPASVVLPVESFDFLYGEMCLRLKKSRRPDRVRTAEFYIDFILKQQLFPFPDMMLL